MKRNYDRILTYFKMNLKVVIPMCITALLFNALMCVVPILEGKTIDSLNQGNASLVLRYCILFLCLVVFVQFNRFCKRFLVRVFGNKMALTMREVSLSHLLKKDISYFSKHNAGDILNRNLSDIYDTTEGIRKMTTECFDTFVLLIGYFITMMLMDWKISFIVFLFIFCSILASQLMKKYVYKANKEYKEYLSLHKEMNLNQLNNELYYRGFGVNEAYFTQFEQSANLLRKKNVKALIFQSGLEPIYFSIVLMGLFFILYMGGGKVINHVYEIGTLSAYLTTFMLVAKKSSKVGKVFNAYQGFKISWQRCKEYLYVEEHEDTHMDPNAVTLNIHNFSYQYDMRFSLPQMNFSAKAGEIIGICGRVHTGKTTLLKALTGLYDYKGEAYLENVELRELKNKEKQYISFCAADVALFSDTLKNNIILNREGNLKKAIEVSCLEDAIEAMGGIDTMISHSTANISGGQQKRVQLARALYPDASLILLDDPFQSVNSQMAEEILKKLKLYSNQIILFSSNNPILLQQTNQIIYLEENQVNMDTYERLYKNIPSFKSLMEVAK